MVILTEDEKTAIREYIGSLDQAKQEQRTKRLQAIIGATGLTGVVVLAGAAYIVTMLFDAARIRVEGQAREAARQVSSEEIRQNLEHTENIKILAAALSSLALAHEKSAETIAKSKMALDDAERVLTTNRRLTDAFAVLQGDLEKAKPVVEAAKNLSSFSDQLSGALSSNETFIKSVAANSAVPSGAVIAFNVSAPDRDLSRACPKGWALFGPAAGRLVVGAGKADDPLLSSYLSFKDDPSKAISGFSKSIGGGEKIKLAEAQLPKHNVTFPIFRSGEFSMQNSGYGGDRFIGLDAMNAVGKASGSLRREASDPIGGGQEIDIRPPYVALYFCVKS